jgi:signal peptidase I
MAETSRNTQDPFALQPELKQNPDLTLVPEPEVAEPVVEANQPAMGWMLLRELVETIVLSLVIFLLIRQVVQNYRIESHSMQPNFQEGQFILVNKLAYLFGAPGRGEVIVFHNPRNTDEDYIKRVIGLPGDIIEIHDQAIYINDRELPQPYTAVDLERGYVYGPSVVPPDHLFVMGDNRPNSRDSRFSEVGAVSEDLVVGKAWLRVWPFSVFGLVAHYHLEPGSVAIPAPGEPSTLSCCEQDPD